MQLRPLGGSGLSVAPLAFGGNVLGWTADEATSLSLLDAFVDDGFNLVDTADVYSRWVPGHGGGESESVIGRWLKKSGKRNRIVLATKVGMDMGDGKTGLAPKYIRQAVDDSLRRLQTDHIDLYQAHQDDAKTPLEESLGTFADLMRAGKVRAIGVSNFDAGDLEEAWALDERICCNQVLYHLQERAIEHAVIPWCEQHGVAVVAYSPFGQGKFPAGNAALAAVARRRHATPGQVALAFLTRRPSVIAIPKAASIAHVEENARLIELQPEDLADLERAFPLGARKGLPTL